MVTLQNQGDSCWQYESSWNQGSILKQQDLMEPWFHCGTVGPHATRVAVLYYRTLWNKWSIVTQQGLVEPRVHC